MADPTRPEADHWSQEASEIVNRSLYNDWRFPPLVIADGRDLPDIDLDALAEAMLRDLIDKAPIGRTDDADRSSSYPPVSSASARRRSNG